MLSFISRGSNYIIMFMCAIYAISCFTVFLPSSDEKPKKRMDRQENYMFIFLTICYFVLFLQTKDFYTILLYLAQVIFFKLLIFIYQHFYPDCSRIMMNHTCFLLLIGFVMLTRLSYDKALKQFVIVVAVSALCLFIPIFMEKAYWLKRLRWFYGIGGLLFLASVFVIGTSKNGSMNWISLGGIIEIQPSEFVKIAFVFFIAAMLAKTPNIKSILSVCILSAFYVIILVAEKDLGGALLYFVIFLFMCYASTGRLTYILGGFGAGAFASAIAYKLFPHIRVRVSAWSDPWKCITGNGYQITQSLFAIGTGGWFGLGLTQGRPGDIPVVESDFIFAAIAEEFGLVFAICLIFIYLGVFVHFLMIAMDVEGRFYKLCAYGFSICLIMQVFLTIGGVTKFIPLTGVTLPLISYGGSSVTSTLIIFAIMQGLFIIAYKDDADTDSADDTLPDTIEGGAVNENK